MGESFEGATTRPRLFHSHESAMKFAADLRAFGEGEWEDCVDELIDADGTYGYWVRDCDWVHVFLSEVEK